MLGGMAAKWRWRAKRRAAGKPTDSPNMVCGPVQVVWHKFAKYWDIEMREIPMSPGRYCMDVEQMLERVDENTIMVVPTFGVTYTGAYEPVLQLSEALDKLQEDTGLDVDIHVDGASGAFLAPFCAPDILWDFRVPRVKSISTSGHKFGLAPLRRGLGPVAGRRGTARRPHLPRDVPRRGHAGVPDQLLPARRPDRRAVLQLHPPRDGTATATCTAPATTPASSWRTEIVKLGPFELLCDSNPRTGIPSVAWRIREGEDPGYTLYDVADRLRNRGWQVPAYPLTGSVADISVQRILVRQGVSRDLAGLLARGHDAGHRPLRPPPRHRLHDEGGVRRLQPPVGGLRRPPSTRPAPGAPWTSRRAGGAGAGSAAVRLRPGGPWSTARGRRMVRPANARSAGS